MIRSIVCLQYTLFQAKCQEADKKEENVAKNVVKNHFFTLFRHSAFCEKVKKSRKKQKKLKKDLQKTAMCVIITKSKARPLSQTVKTSPSHGEDMGSIPVGVTKQMIRRLFYVPAFLMQDSTRAGMQHALFICSAPL